MIISEILQYVVLFSLFISHLNGMEVRVLSDYVEPSQHRLHTFLLQGEIDRAKSLLESSPEETVLVNEQDGFGNTPLIVACKCQYLEAIRILLDKSDQSIRNRKGKRAIDYILKTKRVELVEPFLLRNASLYARLPNLAFLDTELTEAGKVALVDNKYLIEECITKWYVNFSDDNSVFEIVWNEAAKGGFKGLMAYLIMLKKRDSRQLRSRAGKTAFQLAAEANKPSIVELLLQNTKTDDLPKELGPVNNGDLCPLVLASKNGCERIVELLAQFQSEGKIRVDDLQEAENCAKSENIRDIIWAWRVDPIKDTPVIHDGRETQLHVACRSRSIKAIRIILQRYGDKRCLELLSRDSYTPLHTAVYNGRKAIVELLIWEGASIDKKCKDHDMASIHLAAFMGENQGVVDQLGCEKDYLGIV